MATQQTLVQRWQVKGKDTTRHAAASANKNLRTIGKSAGATSASLSVMAIRLGAVAAGYVALREAVQGVNTVQNLNNRLNLVANTNLEDTKQKLFDVARQSFASFESTGQFYAKLALSSKELGRSQEELLKVVEITNKAVAISGSSAQSSAAGLIQFSQGIASNRLAGDELRSVLENLPGLADAIARGLGVTRGEIRSLAAAGKLTATAVIDALLSQEEEVDQYFDRFNATISIAAQQFGNSFVRAIDKVEVHSGAFKRVGVEVLELADSFTAATDEVVRYLDEVGGIEGVAHDLRVEMEVLKVATVSYFTYIASGAVISAGAALIKMLQGITLAGISARGALALPIIPLVAGYYAGAKAVTHFADELAEGSEKANLMAANLQRLEAEAARLQRVIEGAERAGVYPRMSEENLQNLRAELERVNSELRAQQALINAQVGPPASAQNPPVEATEDTSASSGIQSAAQAAITATEERNRRLGQLRQDNLLAELAAWEIAGQRGLEQLQRDITARNKQETENLARRIEEAGKFAEFERAQRDARIQLLTDDRSRELAEEYAAYDDRLELIMREVSDTQRRDELLQEEQRLHREKLLEINADYDQRDKDRQARQVTDGQAFWGALTGDAGAYYGEAAKYKKGDAEYAEEQEEFKKKVLADGVNALAKHSKAAFKIVKVAKIAQAVVDTYSGINRALGEYPPPYNFVMAAAVAAAGFANVAAIQSQQYGGGSAGSANTGSGASASSPPTTTAQTPVIQERQEAQRSITINIGNGVFSSEAVKELIGEINKAAGDGVDVMAGVQ